MVTTAVTGGSAAHTGRFAIWISRFPLIVATIIFTAISAKFLIDPVHSAAARGILLSSNEGITGGRVGLGGFPLAFAIITLGCLVSRRRILAGLYMVLTVVGIVLIVRVVGMVVDSSARQSVHVLIPEIVLLALSLIALSVELRRQERETGLLAT
jgi:hypothetical protein